MSQSFFLFHAFHTISTPSDYLMNLISTDKALSIFWYYVREVAKHQHTLEVSTNNILTSFITSAQKSVRFYIKYYLYNYRCSFSYYKISVPNKHFYAQNYLYHSQSYILPPLDFSSS